MILHRIFRTTAFRLALAYVVLFVLSTAVLFAFVYLAVMDYAEDQLKEVIEAETEALETQAGTDGIDALAATLRFWEETDQNRPAAYLLLDSDGRPLAGDLGVERPHEGWFYFDEPDEDDPMLGLGTELSGDRLLIVAQESELQDLGWALFRSFAWASGASLVLAVLGGIISSAAFLRRLENFNRTAAHIVAGRLGERVPKRGSRDEFDRLADNLNAMLDRIQALMESLRQVSNDIAHDLRTPLSRLRQQLETARQNASDVSSYEQAVDYAIAETDEILATFSALLRIAQIEAGTRRAGFSPINLSAVFETVADTYAAVAEDNGQRLSGDITPGITMHGDRELLTQMLANLVENAIRHTGPGSKIELSLVEGASGPIGSVADNGPGIPAELRERVFRRFFRIETSRTSAGNGLGLSLVAAVADLHGISVDVGDREPGLAMILRFPSRSEVMSSDGSRHV